MGYKSLGCNMKWKILSFFLFLTITAWAQVPEAFYLTWKNDPSHTMTIFWFSQNREETIQFQKKRAE